MMIPHQRFARPFEMDLLHESSGSWIPDVNFAKSHKHHNSLYQTPPLLHWWSRRRNRPQTSDLRVADVHGLNLRVVDLRLADVQVAAAHGHI